ncbi:rhomboid family intramembrane serine protease [Parafilimonas sp.]|uniref:rhomboid family intramembrane serine protease n=1 Tax=Parafilimonas sp. TaxID=1969739 RepID=UPI003F7F86C8
MSFGLNPKYTSNIELENVSGQNFLIVALEAAKKLNWNIAHINETGFTAYGKLSARSSGEEIIVTIENDNAHIESRCIGSQMFDWNVNKKNVERFITSFNEILPAVTDEEVTLKWEALQPAFEANKEKIFQNTEATKGGFFNLFIPVKGYFVTPILIDINILIFILMVISGANILLPGNQVLISWGANFRPLTLSGQWWRVITNCFLHIGILHLLLNMYALLYIGLLLEPRLGSLRFFTAYLLAGIAGSVNSLYWHELTISAGASGAIFGLYGVFLAMLTTNLIEKTARKALLASISVFVFYNLANGMKGGVDNAAHIGGLICGLLIGYAYYPGLKKTVSCVFKYTTLIALAAFVLTTSFIVCFNIPNDIGRYDAGMKIFADNEKKALMLYNNANANTPADTVKAMVASGIHYWNENIKIIKDLDKFQLPDALHERNKIILDYCNLRLRSYELTGKAISENTRNYDSILRTYEDSLMIDINKLKQ